MEYKIIKAETGFIILDEYESGRGLVGKKYAFSTLKEVQDYLPTLFPNSEAA